MKPESIPDKRAARRAFSRAAATFDASTVLHREVGDRLMEHLDPIRIDPARILDLGCGTGDAFDSLARRYPSAEVIGLDFAAPLLARARKRTGWWKRAFAARVPRLVCADAEAIPLAPGAVDMVFSNLALQWTRPEAVFAEAARTLPPGGLFLFSTFGPDTLKELRGAFAAVDAAPHVGTFVDMHDLGDALVHAGFADPVMEMEVLTLEYADVASLAKELRGSGARNAAPARARGLMTPRRWQRMTQAYERQRRDGALPATFEVIYGHAWKAAPRRIADGRQVIGFTARGTR